MKEFELIQTFFHQGEANHLSPSDAGVLIDKGDDCAVLQPSPNHQLVITTDTLVCGTHFLPDIPAKALGYRVLATNLSDLAAMGAKPKWFSLALTLENSDPVWLSEFSQGLLELANKQKIFLTGGDTTKGPLSISITAIGEVDFQGKMLRDKGQSGDDVYVTGTPGDAAGGLGYLLGDKKAGIISDKNYLIKRFYYPEIKIEFAQQISQYVNSALDISDGLLADLNHICEKSVIGAVIDIEKLPLSTALINEYGLDKARELCLSGGDDYELCFTADKKYREKLAEISNVNQVKLTRIGQLISSEATKNYARCELNKQAYIIKKTGYEHFKS